MHSDPSSSRDTSDLPSLTVNTASPRSTDASDLVFDSSRYSGLLSVLEDVIGPTQSTLDQQVTDTRSDDSFSNARDNTLATESDSTLVGQDSDSISGMPFDATFSVDSDETTNAFSVDSTYSVPSPNGETLDHEDFSSFPEADSEMVVDDSTYVVDASSYAEEPIIELEEPVGLAYNADGPVDESTAVPNHRHSSIASVASRFSGVSLLASPRDNRQQRPLISSSGSPTQACISDLLSPVQLSAKLRRFSLHSGSPLKRGDSIDSGYVDGDSWVGPLPLSRSPPLRDWSPVGAGLPQAPQPLLASPATQESMASYHVEAVNHVPRMETLEESVDEGSEGNEDATSLILDAYSNSSSDAEDNYSSPTMRISETSENADEAGPNPPASCLSSLRPTSFPVVFERRRSAEQLPTEQGGQRSSTTNHDLSCKATLTTQPSFDFSDASSRVSSRRHDSLLSSHSGNSTPNTSMYSQDSDAWRNEDEECLFSARLGHDLPLEESFRPEMGQQVADKGQQSSLSLFLSDGNELEPRRCPPSVEGEELEEMGNTGSSTECSFSEPHEGLSDATQDPGVQGNSVSQELLGLDHQSFSMDGVLQFPLPPSFELASQSATPEDAVVLQGVDMDSQADVHFCAKRARATSDLTVKADSDNSSLSPSPLLPSLIDVSSQRSRVESDSSTEGGRASESSHSVENPPEINHAETCESQRLCGEYPDDTLHHSASDKDLASPLRFVEPVTYPFTDQACQSSSSRFPTSSHLPVVSPSSSPSPSVHSETTLRPLLTGRKSLLEASLFGNRAARSERSRSNSPSASHPSSSQPKNFGSMTGSLGSRQRNRVRFNLVA